MLARMDSNLETRLANALSRLCDELNAASGVVWIHDGYEQLHWGPSIGILANEFPSSSVFASDILQNVDETFKVGVCQAFPACDERQFRTLPHPAASGEKSRSFSSEERVRDLVCSHCQLLIPLFLPGADIVFSLFVASQPGQSPSATIPQLDAVADRLVAALEPKQVIGLHQS
jgi:hypothetical protein